MASEDDADSVNDEEYESQGGKNAIIFLIDARLSMFRKEITDFESKEVSKFNIAIKCCRTVMMNKIIAKQKDLVAIVLFGTDKADPKTTTKHVTQLLELNYPSAEAIKELDRLLIDEDSLELQRKYGSSDGFLLADALWCCSSMFSKSGVKLEEKRIILITDDSDPHRLHADQAHMARKRAADMNQVKITLELLPMGGDFNYSTFYKELIETCNGSSGTEEIESSSRLEVLLERVNRLDVQTRRYSRLKWNLGNGVKVGVSLYTLYKEAVVLPKEPLYRATNEPVKRVRQTFDAASGELLLASDIVEYVTIGGGNIVFTSEEKDMLKKVMEPGITLLGFKPASLASEALHCGQPAFAYPEETLIKGSKELMKALVDRCIAKQKVALCCITPRYRAQTKYVCLVPSQETRTSEGGKLTPCGFHVIPLPFYNDTREQTLEKSPKVDNETVELAKRVIRKLKFAYEPSNFKNPKLQQFWANLEAIALEYDAPEMMENEPVLDAEAQTERLGELSEEFNEACSLTGAPVPTSKRSASARGSTPTKRVKEDIDIVEDIQNAIQSRTVNKFTVAQIKDFLTFHRQPVGGMRKAELVEAVYNLGQSKTSK